MITRRNTIKLAAASLIPAPPLVASNPIQVIAGSQSSQGDTFAHRGNPARTGEMLGAGLTVTDPVIVEGYYADDSSGVMRLGMAPAFYNDMVFLGSSPFRAYLGYSDYEEWAANLIGTNFCYAAVGSGVVCIADIDYDLYGLDAITGSILWSYSEAFVTTAESPVIANGLVYVSKSISNDVKVPVGLDAKTGVEVWIYNLNNRVASPMTVIDDLMLFCGNDYQLYALDALTGEYRWHFEVLSAYSGPIAISDGVALLGGYAVELTSGDTIWRASDTSVGRLISNPAVANGVVCFGTDQGNLVALDSKTGESLWQFESGEMPAFKNRRIPDPAISNGIVYFGVNQSLYALDADSGKEHWRYQFRGYDFEEVGSPVLGAGYLFVTFGDRQLYAITNQIEKHYAVIEVNVYAEPSDSSTILVQLSGGTELDYVGNVELHDGREWRKASIGEVSGWIHNWTTDYSIWPTDYLDLIYAP